MIKTIVFDYTGVISAGPIMNWMKSSLVPDDPRYQLIKDSSHLWDLGQIGLLETYRRIETATGVKSEQIWDVFFDKTSVDAEMIALIQQLKKNYQIILFSNHLSELLRKLLDKHQLNELFDEIIISSEHKMKKPTVEFFNLLLSTSGHKPHELVFIDDTKDNVLAGQKLGIDSIQFTSLTELRHELEKRSIL